MPSDFEEQLGLQSSYLERPVSPSLEASGATAIATAFRELIETKYLYQKVTVDFSGVGSSVASELKKRPRTFGKTERIPASILATPMVGPLTREQFDKQLPGLLDELARRPWELHTRHLGDDPSVTKFHQASRGTARPLQSHASSADLRFYLPSVDLRCFGCKKVSIFNPLGASCRHHFDSPYPRDTAKGKEQVFEPVYRCEKCRQVLHTILVRRLGLQLHLCGFAPRRESLASESVPDDLAPILSDAEQAVAEGDTFAAFYHLRTLIECHLKMRLAAC
jgi:hypothetical protein